MVMAAICNREPAEQHGEHRPYFLLEWIFHLEFIDISSIRAKTMVRWEATTKGF
jgi:hypothetical protein